MLISWPLIHMLPLLFSRLEACQGGDAIVCYSWIILCSNQCSEESHVVTTSRAVHAQDRQEGTALPKMCHLQFGRSERASPIQLISNILIGWRAGLECPIADESSLNRTCRYINNRQAPKISAAAPGDVISDCKYENRARGIPVQTPINHCRVENLTCSTLSRRPATSCSILASVSFIRSS